MQSETCMNLKSVCRVSLCLLGKLSSNSPLHTFITFAKDIWHSFLSMLVYFRITISGDYLRNVNGNLKKQSQSSCLAKIYLVLKFHHYRQSSLWAGPNNVKLEICSERVLKITVFQIFLTDVKFFKQNYMFWEVVWP